MSSYLQLLYVGMTNNLYRRVCEHRNETASLFAKRYNAKRLVYFVETSRVNAAIQREKQLKGWLRSKKTALIESQNPKWDDSAIGWFERKQTTDPSLCLE